MFNWLKGKQKDSKDTGADSNVALEEKQVGSNNIFSALKKTSESLTGKFNTLLADMDSSELNDHIFDEIEEILIKADVSLETAVDITDYLRENKKNFKSKADVLSAIKSEFTRILQSASVEQSNQSLTYKEGVLNIYLVVGVNGAGKTTFIGKLAHRLRRSGKKVIVGAGDTFRAAAVDQLKVWAERSGAEFVGPEKDGADPSGVLFSAIETAVNIGANAVLLDTAGRLQNKFNLMEELEKVKRTIAKVRPESANLECLLVLDATTGQNALSQADVFNQAVALDGVILTKLDGSAKGGIVLTIAEKYNLPVKMVGTGEGIEDLKDFETQAFIDALF